MLSKIVSDIMNAAISHKYRSITFSDGITSRKNYENLIEQVHNFVIENVRKLIGAIHFLQICDGFVLDIEFVFKIE